MYKGTPCSRNERQTSNAQHLAFPAQSMTLELSLYPLPFPKVPDSGFAPPSAHSREGRQPPLYDMLPEFVELAKPVQIRFISIENSHLINLKSEGVPPPTAAASRNIPPCCGGGTHSSLPGPGHTSSCPPLPHCRSPRSIRAILARRQSSAQGLRCSTSS